MHTSNVAREGSFHRSDVAIQWVETILAAAMLSDVYTMLMSTYCIIWLLLQQH